MIIRANLCYALHRSKTSFHQSNKLGSLFLAMTCALFGTYCISIHCVTVNTVQKQKDSYAIIFVYLFQVAFYFSNNPALIQKSPE